jgi:hypothetical protein
MIGMTDATRMLSDQPEQRKMTKLSDETKRALSSLADQDTGEFLSARGQIGMVGTPREREVAVSADLGPLPCQEVSSRRIALLSNGADTNAAVNYAIETASSLDAKIDLLAHAAIEAECFEQLEQRIIAAGILYRRIPLQQTGHEEILAYLQANPALIFLVASTDDIIASTLAEEVMPNQRASVPVPLVLINDNPTPGKQGQNTA